MYTGHHKKELVVGALVVLDTDMYRSAAGCLTATMYKLMFQTTDYGGLIGGEKKPVMYKLLIHRHWYWVHFTMS